MTEESPEPNHLENQGVDLWRVMRLDDNGNCFVLVDGLFEPEALALVREYESRGHKQVYWAERSGRP
jgi:hypothetical protein